MLNAEYKIKRRMTLADQFKFLVHLEVHDVEFIVLPVTSFVEGNCSGEPLEFDLQEKQACITNTVRIQVTFNWNCWPHDEDAWNTWTGGFWKTGCEYMSCVNKSLFETPTDQHANGKERYTSWIDLINRCLNSVSNIEVKTNHRI